MPPQLIFTSHQLMLYVNRMSNCIMKKVTYIDPPVFILLLNHAYSKKVVNIVCTQSSSNLVPIPRRTHYVDDLLP